MKTIRTSSVLVGAALVVTALVAAVPAAAAPTKKTQSVDIRFAAMADETPVVCGTPINGLGTTGASAQLMDLRFYVSDVRLVRRDGSTARLKLRGNSRYQVTRAKNGVTLIDLENARGACAEGTRGTNASVRGVVPRGTYVGVRWTLGVPFALNHTDTVSAPAPLKSAAMAWSWQFGRKFAKIEVADPAGPTGTWAESAFLVHLGSTGCTGNPATGETVSCQEANRAPVRLPRFNTKRQQIAVDVKTLVAGNDITVNRADAPGCMSGPTDPECDTVFDALGLDWGPGGSGDGGKPTGSRQSVFRVIRR